jgi:uncharacterized protein YggE
MGVFGLSLGLAGALLASGHGHAPAQATGTTVGPAKAPDVLKEPRTITTVGIGTIRVVPDAVRVSFGVKSTADSVEKARAENEKKAKKVLDGVAGLKIVGLEMKGAPLDVQVLNTADDLTARARARRAAGGGPGGFGPGGPVMAGETTEYQVTQSFAVVVRGKDREQLLPVADRIVAAVLENGVNARSLLPRDNTVDPNRFDVVNRLRSVENYTQVEFFTEDLSEARKQALAKAVAAALEDAQTIAGAAGLKIRDTVKISQQGVNQYDPDDVLTYRRTRLTPRDETELTVRVTVTCTY